MNLHYKAFIEVAMLVNDPGSSNYQVKIISVGNMSPDEVASSIGTGIVREFCDWNRSVNGVFCLTK
jgi:hypothetical protein